MLQGDKITLTGFNENQLYVNGSFIQGKDFEAKNGVVHVIDEVLLPGQPNLVEYLDFFDSFSTLRTALGAASLNGTLEGPGPFTLFAPTDRAFAKLPPGTVPGLLNDIPALTDVLTYHVIAGEFLAVDVAGLTSATTLQGSLPDPGVRRAGVERRDPRHRRGAAAPGSVGRAVRGHPGGTALHEASRTRPDPRPPATRARVTPT
jgi:uncharacterized surface protein with fasciclin (FAS1) repeats